MKPVLIQHLSLLVDVSGSGPSIREFSITCIESLLVDNDEEVCEILAKDKRVSLEYMNSNIGKLTIIVHWFIYPFSFIFLTE